MFVKQITLFIENRPGRLSMFTSLLHTNDIDLAAISLADTTDYGILRVIVDDYEKALNVLHSNGYTANATDVLAVAVPDSPGGLASVMEYLREKDISIAYLYSLVRRVDNCAIIVIRVDKPELAVELFTEKKVRLLSDEDVRNAQ